MSNQAVHLYKVGQVYYYRARIPADLLPYFQGRKEIRRSLKTRNRSHAKPLVRAWVHRLETVFFQMRYGMLTDEKIQEIAKAVFDEYLDQDLKERIHKPPITSEKWAFWNHHGHIDEDLAVEILGTLARHPAHYDPTVREKIEAWTDEELDKEGITLDKKSFEYQKVYQAVGRAKAEAYRITAKRTLEGVSVDFDHLFHPGRASSSVMTAVQPLKTTEQTNRAGISLATAIEKYLADLRRGKNRRSEASIKEYQNTCAHFPLILGDKDLASYTKEDMKRFKDILQKLPPKFTSGKAYRGKTVDQILKMNPEKTLSVSTINGHIRLLKAVFNWSRVNDYIERDPTEIIEYDNEARSKEKPRIPFTYEHLQKMVQGYSNEYATGRMKNRPERFWVPLIALYSGMRLNEICQLRTKDVVQVESSQLWFFNVIEEEGETKVKTQAGIRQVPIHPVLIELGFLDYLSSAKEGEADRLWPNLQLDSKGKYSRAVGNWFNGDSKRPGFNRRHITEDSRITFHSTRHTFRNELKQIRVDNDIASEIVGHEYEEGEAKTYVDKFSLEVKHNELKKVTYGDLDLTPLKDIADSYLLTEK